MGDTQRRETSDLGGAQAQAAPQAETQPLQQSPAEYAIVAHTLLGIDHDFNLQALVEPESVIYSQITGAARRIITEYSEVEIIDGVDYRVSSGNEHFADTPGLFDDLARDELFGCRLVQRVVRPKDQPYEPIHLIANGDLAISAATLHDASRSITVNNSSELPADPQALRSLATVIAAIGADSKLRTQKRLNEEEQKKHNSRLRTRKRMRKIVGGLALAGAVIAGALTLPERVDNWREQRAEQQAEQRAEEQQEQMELAERERQARLAREAKVREFDKQYQLSDEINVSSTNEPIAAQATQQFIDTTVPNFNAKDISAGLAQNISGSPRAINISNYSAEEGSGYREVKLNVKEGDAFRVAHDGSSDDLVVVEFDAKENIVRITDYGPIRGSNAKSTQATQVFIEKVTR